MFELPRSDDEGALGVPDGVANWADAMPGPGLAARLAEVDRPGLGPAELLEVTAGWQRMIAWAQAGLAASLAEFARWRPAPFPDPAGVGGQRTCQPVVSEFAADEVAARMCWSGLTAQGRLDQAIALDTRLPGTLAALKAGRIDESRARVIVQETEALDVDRCAVVEHDVLVGAQFRTAGRLRPIVRRAVLRVDAGATRGRHLRAVADRSVVMGVLPDGIAELVMTGPAPQVATMWTAFDSAARADAVAGDERPVAARRFDAAVELAEAVLAGRVPAVPSGTVKGRRPHIQVTVAASTLAGLDEKAAELDGYGPIAADVARSLAATGVHRHVITDHAGRVLALAATGTDAVTESDTVLGAEAVTSTDAVTSLRTEADVVGAVRAVAVTERESVYRPGRELVEFVVARDRTCTHPICRQPARRCDLDHIVPFPIGPTTAGNLHATCRRHHRMKHRGGWTVHRDHEGRVVWTAPTGHTYRDDPDPP